MPSLTIHHLNSGPCPHSCPSVCWRGEDGQVLVDGAMRWSLLSGFSPRAKSASVFCVNHFPASNLQTAGRKGYPWPAFPISFSCLLLLAHHEERHRTQAVLSAQDRCSKERGLRTSRGHERHVLNYSIT